MAQNNDKRGLASADEETRKRVAKAGGEATKQSRGEGFYEKIGSEGGKTVSQDREHMSEIGKKGAEKRNQNR